MATSGAAAAAEAACVLTRRGGELAVGEATGPAVAAAGAGPEVVTRTTGAAADAGGADVRWLGGGAMAGGGATAGRTAAAGASNPSCCRMIWLTSAELSTLQFWQTKRMGEFAISGVTSKEYFVPHGHWIFM